MVSTDPAAGTQVNNLRTVSLSVGSGPAAVRVPRVIGLSLADATTELTNAGLKIGTTTQTEGEADQIGKVISSDPEPGTKVDGASTVNIAIGSQATTVPVPTVVGQSADDAQRTLEEAGFTVSKETVDGGGDDGSVVGTSPGAGSQAKKGSEVTLQISNGNNGKRPVPNVTGLSISGEQLPARPASPRSAQQAGAEPQFDGRVIEQSPGGGQLLDTGDQVQLVIGKASESTGGN